MAILKTLDPKTVMVVDTLNLCFRFKYAKQFEFKVDLVNLIKSLQKSYRAAKVVVLTDKGHSTYRRAIYPEYKQNRKERFAEQSEQEKAEFEAFFEGYYAALEHLKEHTDWLVLEYRGIEADDIAALTVAELEAEDYSIWLISSDKDWDLLVSPFTSRFSYVTRKETTYDNWSAHYDFEMEDYISIKCLMGDSGDNVKGIDGIGPKRAIDLVKEYGTALDIYASLPINSKYKYIQKLNATGDLIPLNYQLMDLKAYHAEAIGEHLEEITCRLWEYLK